MSSDEALRIRHLWVALDAVRGAVVDWDAALDLAQLIGAELQSLVVEDDDLLGLAQLPIAHEVGRSSGRARRLEREAIEAALARRVQRIVAELERTAKLHNLALHHAIQRGTLLRMALGHGERGDVVLLSLPGVLARGRERPRAAPVVLWYDAEPASAAASDLALKLARHTHAPLVVVFPRTLFASEADIRERFAEFAAVHADTRLSPVAEARADALVQAARAARSSRIVFASDSLMATPEALSYMLEVFAGELILVR